MHLLRARIQAKSHFRQILLKMPRSAIITIGNEILLGKTTNTNLAYLARELALLGMPVEFSLTVKDEPEAIRDAIKQAWDQADIVITTGGLGPTTDDITKKTIADFFGKELVFDDEVWQHVQNLFASRGLPTPEINRNQAMVPNGFRALVNARGTAPGLCYSAGGQCFLAFAGVPLEMKHVFENQARQILIDLYGLKGAIAQKTIHTWGVSESALAELLADFQVPAGVSFAWLPQTGRVDLRFYGSDPQQVENTAERCFVEIGQHAWGWDDETPATALLKALKSSSMAVSAAESCTGGLAQKMITDPPGASAVFLGGVVAYDNQVKHKVLNVKRITLETEGAVSEACAREMVLGIKSLTLSDAGISITGIAGPEGASAGKPVGTVCFGFSVLDQVWTSTKIFNGDRETIRWKASEYAILELLKYLKEM